MIKTRLTLTLMSLVAIAVSIHLSCVQSGPPPVTESSPSEQASAVVVASDTPPTTVAAHTSLASASTILHIDTIHCGIPDPAIDFARRVNRHGLSVTLEIHAGLTRLVADDQQQITPAPELAESFTTSNNATHFDFILRENLRFSNGQPLLASHVKWSWERALRKSTPPSRARIVLGGILGANAITSGRESELRGVEFVDDRRLTVNLTAPQPDFPERLSDPVAAVLHPENVTGWDDVWINDTTLPSNLLHITEIPLTNMPAGAGPFRLVEYVRPELTETSAATRRRCILERNPNYWNPHAPALDGIVATIYPEIWETPETTTRRQRLELERGTLDIADASTDSEEADRQSANDAIVRIKASANPTVRCYVFNPASEPFNEPEVRKAFVAAAPNIVDNEEPRATRIIPDSIAPSLWASTPITINDTQTNKVATRALQINLYFHSLALADEVHESVADAWKDTLNAQVTWKLFEFPDDHHPVPPPHELQIAQVNIDTAATSPYTVLRSVLEAFGTTNMPPQFAQLKSQLDDARHNLDAASRNAIYQQIEQTLMDEAYVLPIYADNWQFDILTQPWVHGLTYPLPGGSYYKDVWLDESAPNRTLPAQ